MKAVNTGLLAKILCAMFYECSCQAILFVGRRWVGLKFRTRFLQMLFHSGNRFTGASQHCARQGAM